MPGSRRPMLPGHHGLRGGRRGSRGRGLLGQALLLRRRTLCDRGRHRDCGWGCVRILRRRICIRRLTHQAQHGPRIGHWCGWRVAAGLRHRLRFLGRREHVQQTHLGPRRLGGASGWFHRRWFLAGFFANGHRRAGPGRQRVDDRWQRARIHCFRHMGLILARGWRWQGRGRTRRRFCGSDARDRRIGYGGGTRSN